MPQPGVVNRLVWMQDAFGLAAGDRVLQKTPFSFDVSVWEFFWPLLAGAPLVVARPGGHRDPAYLAGLIQRERVTVAHFVPSMLAVFLRGARGCGVHGAAGGDLQRRGAARGAGRAVRTRCWAARGCTTCTARPRRRST